MKSIPEATVRRVVDLDLAVVTLQGYRADERLRSLRGLPISFPGTMGQHRKSLAAYSMDSSARMRSDLGSSEADRLGDLEHDEKLGLGQLLDRQLGGLHAVENLCDVIGKSAEV